MTDRGAEKKRGTQPTVTAQTLAAQGITHALIAWLDRFAVDAATYDALAKRVDRASGGAVLVFHGDIPLVLQDIRDEWFVVIGRYNQGARYFAVPKGTLLPRRVDD